MCHEGKICILVNLRPQSDCCCRGEAKVRILNFKITWSEFQRASQNATEQGKVKVCLFNSKTKWRSNGMLLGATMWF